MPSENSRGAAMLDSARDFTQLEEGGLQAHDPLLNTPRESGIAASNKQHVKSSSSSSASSRQSSSSSTDSLRCALNSRSPLSRRAQNRLIAIGHLQVESAFCHRH
jgi:hypothetical protein